MIAKEVDDERRRKQQQKKAAAAEHVHSVHRVRERPTARSTACLTVIVQVSVGHPVDRWMGSVDRPVDRKA